MPLPKEPASGRGTHGFAQKRVAEIALVNIDRIPADRPGLVRRFTSSSNGERLVFQLVMPEDADASKGSFPTSPSAAPRTGNPATR
jgi:hypothetical protein